MPFEWSIIFLGAIFMSAYFSYRAGYRAAVPDVVDQTLFSLEAKGFIEIDDEGNVSGKK